MRTCPRSLLAEAVGAVIVLHCFGGNSRVTGGQNWPTEVAQSWGIQRPRVTMTIAEPPPHPHPHPEPQGSARGGEGRLRPRPRDTPPQAPPHWSVPEGPAPRAAIRRAGPAVGGDWSPSLGSAAALGGRGCARPGECHAEGVQESPADLGAPDQVGGRGSSGVRWEEDDGPEQVA